MKRALYSLENEEFGFFVNQLRKEFEKRKIPHIFVGGTAVQAYLLKMLSEKEGTNIAGLISNPSVRLQDYIRCTDDIDVALKFPKDGKDDIESARRVFDICKSLEGEHISDTGNYIFSYGIERLGARRPIFRVSVEGETTEAIALNISRKPKDLKNLDKSFYNKFIEEGRELVIPHYQDFKLNIRVPKLEHVLATKISTFRAKDSMDLQNLVTVAQNLGKKINISEVEKILLPEHTKKYEKFQSLIKNNNH